MNIQATCNAK